jgi:hypothetical protein
MVSQVCTCGHLQALHDDVAGDHEVTFFGGNNPKELFDRNDKVHVNLLRGLHHGYCTVPGCPCKIFTWAGTTKTITPLGIEEVKGR